MMDGMVQIFNKGDAAQATVGGGKVSIRWIAMLMANADLNVQKGAKSTSISSTTTVESSKEKSQLDKFFKAKKAARKALTDIWRCDIHGLPDKPVLCWRDPENGQCYLITKNNLNYWASLHVCYVPCSFLLLHPLNP